jgi:hypothetical protein
MVKLHIAAALPHEMRPAFLNLQQKQTVLNMMYSLLPTPMTVAILGKTGCCCG